MGMMICATLPVAGASAAHPSHLSHIGPMHGSPVGIQELNGSFTYEETQIL